MRSCRCISRSTQGWMSLEYVIVLNSLRVTLLLPRRLSCTSGSRRTYQVLLTSHLEVRSLCFSPAFLHRTEVLDGKDMVMDLGIRNVSLGTFPCEATLVWHLERGRQCCANHDDVMIDWKASPARHRVEGEEEEERSILRTPPPNPHCQYLVLGFGIICSHNELY